MFSVSSLANLMQDFRDGWFHAFPQLATERSPPPPAPRSSQICGGEGEGGSWEEKVKEIRQNTKQ